MRQPLLRAAVVAIAVAAAAGCARPAGIFSEQNARSHVRILADTIGSRPVGTPANAAARDYIVEALRLYGFDVRVQTVDGRRPELGRTARVSNIIATRPGARREAVALVSHYDSSPAAPGGADDGLGVAVTLEAARVLASKPGRQWTLFVIVTDGEESGLMGAAALTTERDVMDRLQAYVNVEAAGSGSPALLFETGPGNSWLVNQWARRAPHPRGGSLGFEIYKRLPNDTDFSIFKAHGIPGLNFAAVGDSAAYHTARDTADRVAIRALTDLGDNAVALVEALEGVDVTRRTPEQATYFDIGGIVGVSYGSTSAWLLGLAALVIGALAWMKVVAFAVRSGGFTRWICTVVWTALGFAAATGAMVLATWALRAAREVNHPWYARPDRLMLLLVSVALAVGWSFGRAGHFLPARIRGIRHPAMTWSMVLPAWLTLGGAMFLFAPAAAYLLMLPLLAAGILIVVVPASNALAIRAASIGVLAVSGTLWLRETVDLFRFMVAVFGRLPIVTPAFVFAGVLAASAVMVVPPIVAAVAGKRPVRWPTLVTTLGLVAVAMSAGMALTAPAYTFEQPLRRTVRALQEDGATSASWEVGSVEPGLDLGEGAPGNWTAVDTPITATIPWSILPQPFVFRTNGPLLGPAPIDLAEYVVTPVAGGFDVSLAAVPRQPGLVVSFVLPQGITPARTNLPGVPRGGRWTATYVAVPPDGVAWRASFPATAGQALDAGVRVVVTDYGFPAGGGWQRLPHWLPQEHAVWTAVATWSVPATGRGPSSQP